MGISRDSWRKRYKTGATRPVPHKKRKFELGRPAANTKIGGQRIRLVRTRGENVKHRALRLDAGSFSWASEQTTRKTRIVDTMYNATNNELVRTKTLVKGAIVSIDAAPFRQWYEAHYAQALSKKKSKNADDENTALNKKRSNKTQKKYTERQKTAAVDALLIEQFNTGRLLARISSSPGQVGQANGYVLEGKELDFYLRKIRAKKEPRALRLDAGSFSWASEKTTRKTRIVDTMYNATNNELVRTKTLVKGAIVSIDAAPFRQFIRFFVLFLLFHPVHTSSFAGCEDADLKCEKLVVCCYNHYIETYDPSDCMTLSCPLKLCRISKCQDTAEEVLKMSHIYDKSNGSTHSDAQLKISLPRTNVILYPKYIIHNIVQSSTRAPPKPKPLVFKG